jgi:uncharacterized protein
MDFYKCYRACVRAKVACYKSGEPEVSEAEREQSQVLGKRYVSLALSYALFGSAPAVLLVCGRSGSGKSTTAKNMAGLLGWKHVNSDVIRKTTSGLPIYQRSNPDVRQGLYSRQVTDQVYQILLDEALAQVKNNRSIIVDATFGQAKHRALFTQVLDHLNVPYYFLVMQVSDDTLKKRMSHRDKNEQVVSDARLEDFDLLRRIYQEPTEILPEHVIKINAESGPNVIEANIINRLTLCKELKSAAQSTA